MTDRRSWERRAVLLAGVPMLVLLLLPLVALAAASSPSELLAGVRDPLFGTALGLSARTTFVSLAIVVGLGTPLAWWLGTSESRARRVMEILVDVPVVIPPAVVGIALLQTFGRAGLLGGVLDQVGLRVPFTTSAVIIAQVVVSAPFYIQSAAAAFRRVEPDLVIVARTLGQSPRGAFIRVALPLAMPGIIGGAALAWARALGEFGATLLFAGNLPGTTQTMPLAIYTALESDVRLAVAFALVLAAISVFILFALHAAPTAWRGRRAATGGTIAGNAR